jgi:Ankyrin repeat
MLYHVVSCCVVSCCLTSFPVPSFLSTPVTFHSSRYAPASAPLNLTSPPLPQYDSTALMSAAGEGNEEIVRLLLERGANINAANDVSAVIMSFYLYRLRLPARYIDRISVSVLVLNG